MAFGAAVPMWAMRRHHYLVPCSLPSPAPDRRPRSVPSTAGGGRSFSAYVTELEGRLSPLAAELGSRLPGSHPPRSEVPPPQPLPIPVTNAPLSFSHPRFHSSSDAARLPVDTREIMHAAVCA